MKSTMSTDRDTIPVLAVIVVCTLPHLFRISIWSVIACLFIWGYTYGTIGFSWRLPGRMARLLLVGMFLFIAMTTNEGFTIEAFVALLALMICMKLLDISDLRSRMTVVLLCYFLIAGNLFFDDSIYTTTYMFFSVLCATAVLIFINQPGHRIMRYIRLSGVLIIQSMPIVILLFVLFPRISGGIWGRAPIQTAKSGFSGQMTFGDISKMAQSRDVAFRVEFERDTPSYDQLYWRGVVLWNFDGRTWHRGGGKRRLSSKHFKATRQIKYALTLEPHNEHWLMTLDLPGRISLPRSWLLDDFSYYRWRPVVKRVTYTAVSYMDARDMHLERFKRIGTKLPEGINPRTRAMAMRLYGEAEDTMGYVDRVLQYFIENPFVYTLNPPPLGREGANGVTPGTEDLVDSFLFDTRKGFCEHYATGFAFLMRAAKVPTRVVGGYLGGTLNAYGGYLVVRQSQAHVWCEVWVDNRGWVRVDPTAVVAPTRLNGNVAGAVPDEELVGLVAYFRGTPLGVYIQHVSGVLDLINSRWNKWVMGYSVFEQENLFSRFGIDLESGAGPVKAFFTAMVALAVFILVLSVILLHKRRPSRDPLSSLWIEFCRKMEKIGLERQPAQGPVDYMKYALEMRPDLAGEIDEIVRLYIKQRYTSKRNSEEIVLLQKRVKKFRPWRSKVKT